MQIHNTIISWIIICLQPSFNIWYLPINDHISQNIEIQDSEISSVDPWAKFIPQRGREHYQIIMFMMIIIMEELNINDMTHMDRDSEIDWLLGTVALYGLMRIYPFCFSGSIGRISFRKGRRDQNDTAKIKHIQKICNKQMQNVQRTKHT